MNHHPFRDPSKLFHQHSFTRRLIIASYWLVILAAVPLWWRTTSIERLSLPTSRVRSSKPLFIPVTIQLDTQDDSLVKPLREALSHHTSQSEIWKDLNYRVTLANSNSNDGYTVKFADADEISVEGRTLSFPSDSNGDNHKQVEALAQTLSELLVPTFSAAAQHRVAQYSPLYRLAFTLLNEDLTAGPAVLGWDFEGAFDRHILPLIQQLSPLHNFTVESQVQYYGPLAFSPLQVDKNKHALSQQHLTVFVNSAEWTLSSSASNDPVLHFVLFVPSASRRPLHILNADDTLSPSNAFILPQWGGIFIHNLPPRLTSHTILSPSHSSKPSDLDSIFSTFSHHLSLLLGVPPLPPSVHDYSAVKSRLTQWQLDAVQRRRALENIENMPIGKDVKGDIVGALDALDQAYTSRTLSSIFTHSAKALTLSSRAFFSPGMLALLYFPAEHKYAVYTPLFASALIPVIVTAVKEYKAWKAEGRGEVAKS
ncbi:hypothetical protein AX16_005704 [Volvariella volvacea WC 439]|nr:hypothetical protein AX16_005704 [Volvariella volvacea WC 439]